MTTHISLQSIFSRIKAWARAHRKISFLCVLLAVFLIFLFVRNWSSSKETYTVERGSVESRVLVTGAVRPDEDARLSFGKSGTVSSVFVKEGDRVSKGQILAVLDSRDVDAAVRRASEATKEAEVSLQNTERSASREYSDARAKALAQVRDSYSKSDDAVRNIVDRFFVYPRSQNTYIEFSYNDGTTRNVFPLDSILKATISGRRTIIETLLTTWNAELARAYTDTSSLSDNEIDMLLTQAEKNLNVIKDYLDLVSRAVNSISVFDPTTQSIANGYRDTIATARNSVQTSFSSLITVSGTWTSAPRPLANGEFDTVARQRALLAQRSAEVESAGAQREDTILRSPLDGVIGKKLIEVGETVQAGEEALFVLSDKSFSIEANVSEINIGRVTLNAPVRIVYDAYPDTERKGSVVYREQSETLIDGVVNYRIKVSHDTPNEMLLSGMTANLTIVSERKDNVLKVPSAYLERSDEDKKKAYVVIAKNEGKETERREVILGLRGSDGTFEIEGGLLGGEILLIPQEK